MIATIVAEVGAAIMQHELGVPHRNAMPTVKSYGLPLGRDCADAPQPRQASSTPKAMLEHLIERDRRHARPHARLANWRALRHAEPFGDPPDIDTRLAFENTQRARSATRTGAGLAIDGVLQLNCSARDTPRLARRGSTLPRRQPQRIAGWLFQGLLHAFAGDGEPAELNKCAR